MGYPLHGVDGSVVSWGSANFYSALLSRMSPTEARLNIPGAMIDTTGLGASTNTYIPSLAQWDATITGHAFTTPIVGNQSVVTFAAGGYTKNVESFVVDISAPVFDYTSLNEAVSGTAPTWRSFRPGPSNWSATVNVKLDSGTAMVGPDVAPATGTTCTFTYQDDATDEKLSGTAFIESVDVNIAQGSLATATLKLRGTGALTPAGDGSPFGTTAFGVPIWSAGGSAAGAIVIASKTGTRTFSGADSFWKLIQLTCNVGESVKIVVGVQGTGAMTIA